MRLLALLLAVAAAGLSALCAATESAFADFDPDRSGRNGGDDVPPAARRPLLYAVVTTRLTALVVSAVAAALAIRVDERSGAAGVLLCVVITAALVLLAEAMPRAVGSALAPEVRRGLVRAMEAVVAPLRPLAALGPRLEWTLERALPDVPQEHDDREAPSPARAPAAVGTPPVRVDQRQILRRVFSLGETEVRDVMVPRVDIVGIELGAPWSAVLDRVRSSQHARLPVYHGTIDDVVGILYAKDVLPAMLDDDEPPASGWLQLVRPAVFVPEFKTVDAQLRDFRATRTHIAIVVDEYGGTAGLLTIEDVLEEIVGDIRDEYDTEAPPIEAEPGGRFWVAGRVSLDDLSQALGHQFEREGVSTVGGLVYDALGRVPSSGEELAIDGFRVVVERVVRRRIERVYFERQEELAERVR